MTALRQVVHCMVERCIPCGSHDIESVGLDSIVHDNDRQPRIDERFQLSRGDAVISDHEAIGEVLPNVPQGLRQVAKGGDKYPCSLATACRSHARAALYGASR